MIWNIVTYSNGKCKKYCAALLDAEVGSARLRRKTACGRAAVFAPSNYGPFSAANSDTGGNDGNDA